MSSQLPPPPADDNSADQSPLTPPPSSPPPTSPPPTSPPPGAPAPPPPPGAYGIPATYPASSGYSLQGAPSNYLVWAILTTIFCCLPLGVVSIVYAAQVNSKWAMGDVNGAMESSKNARNFAIISAVIWAVIGVIWIIVVVLGAALSGGSSSSGSSL